MSDIDDELLALAGGGDSSSDEEPSASHAGRRESRSPLPPASTSAKKKDAATTVKGVATKKAPVKKARKRAKADESEEEGEASSAPGTPMSQQSASMDESSDSDASGDGRSVKDEENRYPVEGLFVSLAEKAEIMGMREVEREFILAERREEHERLRQNRMLRQWVINQDNEETKRKKRKAGAADLDESQRKTTRVRSKTQLTSPRFETLRKAREDRSNRAQQRELERDRRKDRSPSFQAAGGDDGDAESEIEWAAPGKGKSKSRTPEVREIPPAELRDIERVRVGRSRFGEVCFYPGFDAAITGCYARISIGPDPTTHQPVYRLALIKGFSQGKPYAVANSRGKQFVTDQYVKAAHGKSVRDWPFIMCSDSPITEAEWERYKKTCLAENVTLPNRQTLTNKISDINGLVQRSWTDQEIREKLDRQNALKLKFGGFERERLTKELRRARDDGDVGKMAQIQDELDKLETPRLAFKTSLTPTKKRDDSDPSSSGGAPQLSQQDRLALVNAENRRRNQEEVRKAQLKERARARELEARIERGEVVDEDHSRRLKTRAKFVHDVNELREPRKRTTTPNGTTVNSGTSTPATTGAGTPRLGALNTSSSSGAALLPHLAKLQQARSAERKAGIPVIHKPLTDDDFIGALDLDIDVEID